MANPTTQQLLQAIGALARSFTLPAQNGNQTGIFNGIGNQLQIPINNNSPQGLYNQQLGSNLAISVDSNYIYINQNIGDVAGGG